MPKNYSFDEAMVTITSPVQGRRIAIFDVSPTIECRWIAIGDQSWNLLTVFGSTNEMLEFVAYEQIHGAIVPNDDKWLDEQVQGNGFDTWDEFVKDMQSENEKAAF